MVPFRSEVVEFDFPSDRLRVPLESDTLGTFDVLRLATGGVPALIELLAGLPFRAEVTDFDFPDARL